MEILPLGDQSITPSSKSLTYSLSKARIRNAYLRFRTSRYFAAFLTAERRRDTPTANTYTNVGMPITFPVIDSGLSWQGGQAEAASFAAPIGWNAPVDYGGLLESD